MIIDLVSSMEYELLFGAIGSLSAAIVYLYKLQVKQNKRIVNKLDQCEAKHEKANEELLKLTYKVGKLTGTKEMYERVENKIEAINNG